MLAHLSNWVRPLDALVASYERMGKTADLARIYDAQIERLHDNPTVEADFLRRQARLVSKTLEEPDRARSAWENLLI